MGLENQSKTMTIDFMYIDLQTCGRCMGTEDALDAAIAAVRPALEALGVKLEVTRTLVESEEQAAKLRFQSSPTIRVGGRDVAGELKESDCADCGNVGGVETDCRVWSWRGGEYTSAPIGMLVEAILRAAISPEAEVEGPSDYVVPNNLKQFFSGKRNQSNSSAAAAEASCCGPTRSGSCSGSCGC